MRFLSRLLLLAALLLGASGLATAPATADPSSDAGTEAEPVTVLVRPVEGLRVAADGDLGDVDGVTLEETLDEAGLVQVAATEDGLAALEVSGLVEEILVDQPLSLFLDASTELVEADLVVEAGFDGSGSIVAVIDSGLDPSSGAFAGRLVAEACFLATVGGICPTGGTSSTAAGSSMPCPTPAADCGHGTHVAGIAVSSLAPIEGVAPAAGLVAIRVMKGGVLNPTAISSNDVIAALDHVLSLARSGMNIAAVNLSLGGDPSICDDTVTVDTWESLGDALAAEGVAVIAASGNSADSLVPITDVAFPACVDNIISVGATERSADTGLAPDVEVELTEFTQYGGGLDLVAPGFDIESVVPGGTAIFDGTSMAAPHVAAAFALLDGSQSGWTPDRYAELLRATGVMVERQTADPDDRHERFAELRLGDALDFEPFSDATFGFWVIPADWAKYTGVSTGVGGNLYDPDTTLTRGQAVTFLWRVMGQPAPSGPSGFTDVPDGTFYTDAVAWAAQEGITSGTGGGLFEPDEPVTRAQMATFLWRLVGEPGGSPDAGFSDVPPAMFFTQAVNWMAETGITVGTTPTTFAPDDIVTRAQMITFVWRLMNAPDAWTAGVTPPELALF